MPVIISQNTNGDTTVTKKSNAISVTPKFFNTKLTGSTTAISRGYFNANHHTFAHISNDYVTINNTDKSGLQLLELRNLMKTPEFGTIKINDKSNKNNYYLHRIIPTMLTIPLSNHSYELGKHLTYTISKDNLEYPINNFSGWTTLFQSNDIVIKGTINITALGEFRIPSSPKDTLFIPFNEYLTVIYRGDEADLQTFELVNKSDIEITKSNDIFVHNIKQTDNTKAFIIANFTPTSTPFSTRYADAKQLEKAWEKLEAQESVYTTLLANAHHINTNKIDIIKTRIENMLQNQNSWKSFDVIDDINNTLARFNWFDAKDKTFASVADITKIYNEILKYKPFVTHSEFENALHKNIRIMLASNISKLDQDKPNIYKPDLSDATKQAEWNRIKDEWSKKKEYSDQQKRIILSEQPLVIAQAGAGSGKSHTVVGRLNYLQDQHENLNDVLVLSFTNAAADNIKDRFPNIQSKTLARMFDDIYRANYPKQELSSIQTLVNTLQLINMSSPMFTNIPHDKKPNQIYTSRELTTIKDLLVSNLSDYNTSGNHFKRVDLNMVTAVTLGLVSDYSNAITAILDSVGQTSLELEPIIIHHKLQTNNDDFIVPDEYSRIKYVITDESQDISTFEYTLLLEYIHHNKAQFLIVGDGSQTLYEFRSSDPRYMNALENSGVFENYKLETNYRSKQAILSYANEFLKVIDANAIAKIQLHANDKTPLTLNDFQKRIILRDVPANANTTPHESFKDIMKADDVVEYILDKLRKNEQICFVAWSHIEINAIKQGLEEILKQHNITEEIVSLAPSRSSIAPIWTASIANSNHTLRALKPSNNINNEIKDAMLDGLSRAYPRISSKQKQFFEYKLQKTLHDLFMTSQWRYMVKQTLSRAIKMDSLISYLYDILVRIEKREISAGNFLKSQERPDITNAKLIVSTIHSVKGYEFDNVVLAHDSIKTRRSSGSKQQEIFRMLFVGLSRAKNSELILNYVPTSRIIREDTMLSQPMETAKLLVEKQLSNNQTSN